MKNPWLAFGLVALLAGAAQAEVLIGDNFDAYTTGNLVGQGSWGSHSGTGSNPVQVLDGAVAPDKEISLTQASGSREDVYRELGRTMGAGDKWYAGYTVTVTGPVSASDYFASFYELRSGSNYFPSKVGVTTATGADFTFYIHQGSGSTQAPYTVNWPTGFAFGESHRLVVSYEYDTGIGELWIDPSLSLGQDGSVKILTQNQAGSSLIKAHRYAFRQGSNQAGTQVVDDVIVATTWAEVVPEPATAALLALAAFSLARRRR